ncbi:MAG: Ribosomal RNA adenine dimethylase [Methanosaeta sp. PtaB.Bin039]|nr:MAG: Ribosomal RNA adenine dimethylase [Methanosaeta sp. PtaB.Bin039]
MRRDGERRAAGLEIDPSWSVLDLGAGTEILALPLSRRARQVTAVEPSSAMAKRLEKHIAERGDLKHPDFRQRVDGSYRRSGRSFSAEKYEILDDGVSELRKSTRVSALRSTTKRSGHTWRDGEGGSGSG